jgi:hypothetical protein
LSEDRAEAVGVKNVAVGELSESETHDAELTVSRVPMDGTDKAGTAEDQEELTLARAAAEEKACRT